jgi:anaerobic C4-dicarboxylate transporter
MNLNDSCVIDAFLIEPCLAEVQAMYLLPLKLTLSSCQTEMSCIRRIGIFHFRFVFFFTEIICLVFKVFIYLVR